MNHSQIDQIHLSQIYTCSICYLQNQTLVSISICSHLFCKNCISAYLELKITEGQVLFIPCPNPGCPLEVSPELISSILPSSLSEKHSNFRKKKLKEKNPNFRWCPKPDCSGSDSKTSKNSSNKLTCSSCSFEFCFLCTEAWHKGSLCRNFQGFDGNMKRCPNCKVFIEKSRGCPQMTCPTCGFMFCWICEQGMQSHHIVKCLMNSKKDTFFIYVAVFLIFFHFCVFFLLPIFIFMYLDFLDETKNQINCLKNRCNLRITYLVSTLLSPVVVVIAIPVTLVVLGIYFSFSIVCALFERSKKAGWAGVFTCPFIFLGVTCLILIAGGLIYALFPVVGVVLLIFKIIIMLK